MFRGNGRSGGGGRFGNYGGSSGFRRGGSGGGFAPVKVGEELDVSIEGVGEKGDGIAKKNGFVLFVPNTKQGDHVKVKVTKVLNKVGFAEVVGKSEAPVEESSEDESTEESDSESEESTSEESSEESVEDSEDFGEEEDTE